MEKVVNFGWESKEELVMYSSRETKKEGRWEHSENSSDP